jgi:hypothetical protein
MSNEDLIMMAAVFTEDIVAGVILALAAYWAFAIRGALKGEPSRSQALWLGVVCLFLIPALPTPESTDALGQLVIGVFYGASLPLVLVAWIDGTVRAARRSDPLFRNTLAWSGVRIAVWVATLAAVASYFSLFAIETLTATNLATAFGVLIGGPYVPVFVAGTPALLLAVRRTKSETRRANLRWLGLFALSTSATIAIAFVLLSSLVGQSFPSGFLYFLAFKGIYAVGYNVFQIFFIIGAYCLYRNSRSLALLNRVEEPSKTDLLGQTAVETEHELSGGAQRSE